VVINQSSLGKTHYLSLGILIFVEKTNNFFFHANSFLGLSEVFNSSLVVDHGIGALSEPVFRGF
jgi:hypothetical protein